MKKCICCEKELENVYEDDDEDDVYGGYSKEITVGYGSQFDFCVFGIVICDNCITEKTQKDILIYKKNNLINMSKKEFKIDLLNKK